MKRLTALVLALALLLSLTACVEKPQTQNIYYGKYLFVHDKNLPGFDCLVCFMRNDLHKAIG